MTLYRGTFLDTPVAGSLRALEGVLQVEDGVVVARGPAEDFPAADVDLRGGVVLPGLVDTHVHFPQVRAIGGLGMPLLDWLDQCALPEECRLASPAYAAEVAAEFVDGLARAGTTTALVFGSHFAPAVDALFTEAARVGLRVTSGLVVSDRLLPPELLTSPERALDEGRALAERWHGVGRSRYAVTPRFSLSCSPALLESCASLLAEVDGAFFTSHVNENLAEVAAVAQLHGGYVDSYDRFGLLSGASVLAHDVHPTDAELAVLAARGTTVAHCPTSNAALGSGLFPLRRHRAAGVRVALGSDVGAGTGFCLLKEGLQAYFGQRLLGDEGEPLTPADLLHLATATGAEALGLPDVGHLSVGMRFDAVWVRPQPGCTLDVALRTAADPDAALAKVFALAGPPDLAGVWIDGQRIRG
ncbi:guanine deaminase [Klenkia marina]|uniref:Guanine deaminase n=1 Tax=Klenkia marina TaxID=1960309 RepID=A0A1G4XUM3_9ACTN|nr:guanine deaminase [Klenkia marina]SCX44896.1 guanine deaminase [Klenkia marina]